MSFWTMPLPGLMRKKAGGLNVADVFKTTLYTGNGSTQTINNGIDLAGEGGLVWVKLRNLSDGHYIFDTHRTGYKRLNSASTAAEEDMSGSPLSPSTGVIEFTASGFKDHSGWTSSHNASSWTFRKAPKFFDIVTYTGDAVVGRQISHGLGVAPGMIVVKVLNTTASWAVWHRNLAAGANGYIYLDSTAVEGSSSNIFGGLPTDTHFTVGPAGVTNANGGQYVAYLFAHDPSPEGIIQCGSFTSNSSGDAGHIDLGWSPQYLMVKRVDSTGNWEVLDTARGWGAIDNLLYPNLSGAESSGNRGAPDSTGFTAGTRFANATYIYVAIRAEGV